MLIVKKCEGDLTKSTDSTFYDGPVLRAGRIAIFQIGGWGWISSGRIVRLVCTQNYVFISITRIKLYHSPNSSITLRRPDAILFRETFHGFDNSQKRRRKID